MHLDLKNEWILRARQVDWDSLEQINLVVAIQDAFGIKFNIDEVNAMKNLGEMADAILEKTGE